MGFLRKKSTAEDPSLGGYTTANRNSFRRSLSLPDLTTPLIDPASWEEVPVSIPSALHDLGVPSTPTFGSPSARTKAEQSGETSPAGLFRSPSKVKEGAKKGFHRPFTPWQVIPRDRDSVSALSGPEMEKGAGEGGDFRVSMASSWGRQRDSTYSKPGSILDAARIKSRRAKSKAPGRLNMVIVGGKGVGKTSFINLLVGSLSTVSNSDHEVHSPLLSSPDPNATQQGVDVTLSSPTTPGAPMLHNPKVPAASVQRKAAGPTTRMSSRLILVDDPELGYEKTEVRLIDTPGLEVMGGGDAAAVQCKERERGVGGILRLAEERFDVLLREERKVIRRKTGGDEDLVHLIVYLLDARSILRPASGYEGAYSRKVDWSGVGVWDDPASSQDSSSLDHPTAGISKVELDIIRRLSSRANVLPVLTHIDSLSITELQLAREAVRRDLGEAFQGQDGAGFGVFGEEIAEESESDGDDEESAASPAAASKMPFAIFTPSSADDLKYSKKYPWGEANVFDASHSDFQDLRDAVLGEQIKILRIRTRETLYEQYRTERLLATRDIEARITAGQRSYLDV